TTGNATLSAGGAVTQSGAISATGLALAGTGGAYTLRHAGNAVTTLAAQTGSIDYSQTGALAVGTVAGIVGVSTTGAAKIETTGAASSLTLNNAVTSSGTGDAIVLKAGSSNAAGVATGGQLINNAGVNGISAVSGRYLVYSGDPALTAEGVAGYSKRYNTAAGFTPGGSSSMFLYRVAPVLTITSNNAAKVYGQANPVFTGSDSGYIDGDTAASVGVTRSSAAVFNTPVSASGIAITSGATNSENYTLVLSHGQLAIEQATISSVGGITAGNKVVDGNTSATLNTGGASYAGIVAGDVLSVDAATGTFDTPYVGNNKTVFIRGIRLGGAAAANYRLDKDTATSTANISDLSSLTGPVLFRGMSSETPVPGRGLTALTVADANTLLESNAPGAGACEGAECVAVTVSREATSQSPGVMTVSIADPGAGFRFAPPAGLLAFAEAMSVPLEAASLSGRPLPGWLKYDPLAKSFAASAPPPGALPLQLRVSAGGRSVVLTLTAGPAARGVVVQRDSDPQPGGS
ncbi:MAG: YDG domain-containing protein, partial [Polaromonas sp.]|nr:YDG domain-containing protein [Polaromonas sp.]